MLAALRRLRRKLTMWRVVAIAAMVAAAAAIFWETPVAPGGGDHIARVRIDGMITGDQRKIALIGKLAENDKAKALIVRINSPGGTTSGSEALYDAIRRVAEKKPVVAVMDSVAASGGYIVALAAERIQARGNTITGSIGVLFQWPEVGELMNKVGVRMHTVRSGPLKAEPDMFSQPKPEVVKVIEELVADSFDWFVGLVAKRRKMTREQAARLADGRVYTGRQALKAGLIDAMGGEREAREWLEEKKGLRKGLKIIEHKPKKKLTDLDLPFSMARAVLSALGLAELPGSGAAKAMTLDGLVSIWHPALQSAGGRK